MPTNPRALAVQRFLLEVVETHLSPVDEKTLLGTAKRLLDEALADYEINELRASLDLLCDIGCIKRDRGNRIVPSRVGRSALEISRAFGVAQERAARVAELDAPRGMEPASACQRRALDHRLLKASEERHLGLRSATGNRDAINELVVHNTRLVWSLTSGYSRAACGAMDREDYFQEGCLGLIRAAEKFDARRGFRFSTYASAWIKQASRRAQADRGRAVRLPVHVYERVRPVRAFASTAEEKTGITPERDEIAAVLRLSENEVRHLLEISEPILSLDHCPNLLAQLDRAFAPDGHRGRLTRSDVQALIDDRLDERQRLVISLRYGLGARHAHTLDEVGTLLGITRERVRQIQSGAVKTLAAFARRYGD